MHSGSPRLRRAPGRALRRAALFALVVLALPAMALDSVQWNGFALLRPETPASGRPLDDDSLSAQLQVGIDWRPSVALGGHLHLLARNESDGSRRGHVGVVEAFLEQNFRRGNDRIHLMEGAFFLPGSRENIDSLWESPYTITSSALNSWMGEEFRPIGMDASYTHRLHRSSIGGAVTLYRGNDTFGALPVDRGWALRDHWTLLGEHIPVNAAHTIFTSVSAETDGRIGWAARARWNTDRASLQFTRIDNRADALRYGELFNWATRFNIAAADYTWKGWTAIIEIGWGTTAIQPNSGRRSFPIRAGYVMVSRQIASWRASLRAEEYEERATDGQAVTAAVFWEPPRARLRTGIEAIATDVDKRLAVELRYRF